MKKSPKEFVLLLSEARGTSLIWKVSETSRLASQMELTPSSYLKYQREDSKTISTTMISNGWVKCTDILSQDYLMMLWIWLKPIK